jgi:hypothetical protein
MATQLKLLASDAVEFGKAVAVSGDYAIVGARQPSPTSLVSPGSAYIFAKSGSGWTQQAKLAVNVNVEKDDEFGAAVAIEGDYAIVGAPSDAAVWEGRAYIFHREGSTWVQQSALAASDAVDFANFGSSVALSGDWAIVGSDTGAYVFQRTDSTWTEQAKLGGPGAGGFRASISGQTAVISGPQKSVLVFQRNGSAWQQQALLTASDANALDYFGTQVSVSGDRIIAAGAKYTNSDYSGAAYIFERTGSNWTQQAKLESVPPSTKNRFAWSIAISGDYAVVGDPDDKDIAPGGGAAYLYRRKVSGWPMIEKIAASDASIFDSFGASVAIDGSVFGCQAIAGAEDNNAGAAYVLSNFPGTFDGVIDPDRWAIYARILFGLVGGGGGVIWLPGSGPVPVDPEPFKVFTTMSPRKRDVLVGLAISEMANLIYDGSLRHKVQSAGVELMKQAASQVPVPREEKIIR